MKHKTNKGAAKVASLLMLLMAMTFAACQDSDAEDMQPAVPTKPDNTAKPDGSLKANDVIRFGTYSQNSPQKDSISWRVLRVDGEKALLLAVNLLSSRPWDATGQNLTWDNSSIRQWLNGEFLNEAFSSDERNAILLSDLDNSDQHGYGTPAGKNTTDKVFLLSVNEYETLVKNTPYATASPTSVAVNEGAYANGEGNSAWWLRSPGMAFDSPAYLSSAGELGTRAHKATEKILGIRPAIWISTARLK